MTSRYVRERVFERIKCMTTVTRNLSILFFLSKAFIKKTKVSYFPTIDVDYKFHFSIGCHYTIGSLVLMYSSHDRKYTSGVSIINSILP